MSVGISIYRVIFKIDEEEIVTDEVYEKKDKNVRLFGQMKKEEVYDEFVVPFVVTEGGQPVAEIK